MGSECRDRPEEQQLSPSTRKRVTFDSNVKTYELDHVEAEAEADVFLEKDRNSKEEKDLAEIAQCKSYSEDGSTVSSVSSYPLNHRYHNCRDTDDEDEVLDCADSELDHDNADTDDYGDKNDFDDVDDDEEYDNFSNGEDGITESSGKDSVQVFADEVDSCLSVCGCPRKNEPQIGSRWNARDRSARVHSSVLKPVENLSQWKAVKVEDRLGLNPHKENFKESSFSNKSKTCQPKNSNQDVAVDASLSSWLSSSEVTPTGKTNTSISGIPTPESQGSNSLISQEDRPILGALTMEELKQFSTSPSPKKSPNMSPDEMPIIRTVGTFWSHSSSVEDFGYSSSFKRLSNTNGNYREMRVE